jgi:hypothetical protein
MLLISLAVGIILRLLAALEGLSGVPPAAQLAGMALLIGLNLIALALLIQIRRWFFPRAHVLPANPTPLYAGSSWR